MKIKYKLIIKDVGNYGENSLIKLIWIILKHRCQHFFKGEGWRD